MGSFERPFAGPPGRFRGDFAGLPGESHAQSVRKYDTGRSRRLLRRAIRSRRPLLLAAPGGSGRTCSPLSAPPPRRRAGLLPGGSQICKLARVKDMLEGMPPRRRFAALRSSEAAQPTEETKSAQPGRHGNGKRMGLCVSIHVKLPPSSLRLKSSSSSAFHIFQAGPGGCRRDLSFVEGGIRLSSRIRRVETRGPV